MPKHTQNLTQLSKLASEYETYSKGWNYLWSPGTHSTMTVKLYSIGCLPSNLDFGFWSLWIACRRFRSHGKAKMPLQIQLFLSNVSQIAGQSLLMWLLLLELAKPGGSFGINAPRRPTFDPGQRTRGLYVCWANKGADWLLMDFKWAP